MSHAISIGFKDDTEMNKNSIIPSKYWFYCCIAKLLASKKSGEMLSSIWIQYDYFIWIQIMDNQTMWTERKRKKTLENQNNLVNCQRYLSLNSDCVQCYWSSNRFQGNALVNMEGKKELFGLE